MKKIVQPAKYTLLQKAIIEYTCDRCGHVLDWKHRKQTVYSTDLHKELYYCKQEDCGE